MWHYHNSQSLRLSKWPNDRIVAVVKQCVLLVQRRMTKDYCKTGLQENKSTFIKSGSGCNSFFAVSV